MIWLNIQDCCDEWLRIWYCNGMIWMIKSKNPKFVIIDEWYHTMIMICALPDVNLSFYHEYWMEWTVYNCQTGKQESSPF